MTTLAERLGFAATDRVAVVHVDDLGMCHAANEGGFEALDKGPATCGSIMVPCPWFRDAADRARAKPGIDLGVHLTLNSEWPNYRWGPVAGRSRVPTLLDDQGFLPRTTQEAVDRADPEEVEIELRAQVDAALDAGVDVTHLDSHMGTCFFPKFVDVYARLAVDYGVPIFAMRPSDEALRRAPFGKGLDTVRSAIARLDETGVPILDHFDANSLGFAEGGGEKHNLERIAALREGVTYLICHAAKDGPELRAACDTPHQREFERTFYGGEAGRKALEEAGVKTVGMRALRDLMKANA
jgi:predicted glycoside hydrolase/deacetylase ChbG (UPF0249 family)